MNRDNLAYQPPIMSHFVFLHVRKWPSADYISMKE